MSSSYGGEGGGGGGIQLLARALGAPRVRVCLEQVHEVDARERALLRSKISHPFGGGSEETLRGRVSAARRAALPPPPSVVLSGHAASLTPY